MREAHLNSTKKMFALLKCDKIQKIENLITDEVVSMDSMFFGCSNLTELDLSGFNTDKVTGMRCMFISCSSLKELDLTGFNTDNVTNMSSMFYGCQSLTTLDISNFNTAKVTNMGEMFYGCSSLSTLDLSHFNTAKVINMNKMFCLCEGLAHLDINSFDISNVEMMDKMFDGCYHLITIHCEQDWSIYTPYEANNLFADCIMLYGDKGTKWKPDNEKGLAYARLDGLDGKPGYFSSEHPSLPNIIYSEFKDNTLTYYYDNLFGTREGIVEKLNITDYPRFASYYKSIHTVIIDASVKNAGQTPLQRIFHGYDIEHHSTVSFENMTEIKGGIQ